MIHICHIERGVFEAKGIFWLGVKKYQKVDNFDHFELFMG